MNKPHLGFFDIHSHLLPGLDDGPEEYGQCLEAAERYHAIGVECVIATPHWIQGTRWAPSPDLVRATAAQAQEKIRNAGIPLLVLPGMEIALSDFLCGHFTATDFVSLGEKGFFLIEFPLSSGLSAPTLSGILTLLTRQRDNHFIIAHPERCAIFQDNFDRVRELVSAGMLMQVNISSILGHSGRRAQATALELFNAGLVHFLGTDSHARAGRMPPEPREMAQLARLIGSDTLAAAFRDNPLRLLSGKEVLPLQVKVPVQGNTSIPEQKGFMQNFLQLFRQH